MTIDDRLRSEVVAELLGESPPDLLAHRARQRLRGLRIAQLWQLHEALTRKPAPSLVRVLQEEPRADASVIMGVTGTIAVLGTPDGIAVVTRCGHRETGVLLDPAGADGVRQALHVLRDGARKPA